MHRPARILLNAATAVSLVLCVGFATIATMSRGATRTLWSHLRGASGATFLLADSGHVRVVEQRVSRTQPGITLDLTHPGLLTIHSTAGGINLATRDGADPDKDVSSPPWRFGRTWSAGAREVYSTIQAPSPAATDFACGFALDGKEVDVVSFAGSFSSLYVPHWFLVTLSGSLPLGRALSAAICRMHGRRRTRAQRCRSCGYDLRATPDRCPECGKASARS